jgi:copper homeostasis protein (lipoprotein)
MIRMRILVFSFLVLSLFSCTSKKKKAIAQKEFIEHMAHSSKNALDWVGTYRGMLPCDDCEGIQTEIKLFKHSTYELAYRHEGKDKEIYIDKGNVRWSADGNSITFYSGNNTTEYANYFVGENQLIKLDNEGNKIVNEFSQMYVLKKKGYDDRIAERHWQLIELNGKKVEPIAGKYDLHFMLKYKDSSVFGYGGCNRFAGHFELMDGNRIYFTKMLNTLIACKNAEQEQAYLKVFELIDNYTIKNDTLSLAKARMASMAKFKAIYMR